MNVRMAMSTMQNIVAMVYNYTQIDTNIPLLVS